MGYCVDFGPNSKLGFIVWKYPTQFRLILILEELRKKALYHNSIEIWIGISEEKKIDWVNTDNYQKFIAFLVKNELNMKQMTICFDESDNASYGGHSKKVFANNLAAINNANSHCYSIKLKDSAIELIRTFVL